MPAGNFRVVSIQHQIGGQQLGGLLVQCPVYPVGKETHAAHRRHRHHQRGQQYAELPGSQFAAHQSQRQRQTVKQPHGAPR